MAYEPTVWATGDVVTSQKLNKLEEGVANSGGGLSNLPVIKLDGNDTTPIDEIRALAQSNKMFGIPVIVEYSTSNGYGKERYVGLGRVQLKPGSGFGVYNGVYVLAYASGLTPNDMDASDPERGLVTKNHVLMEIKWLYDFETNEWIFKHCNRVSLTVS